MTHFEVFFSFPRDFVRTGSGSIECSCCIRWDGACDGELDWVAFFVKGLELCVLLVRGNGTLREELTPASFGQSLIEDVGGVEFDSVSCFSVCVSTWLWTVTVAIVMDIQV